MQILKRIFAKNNYQNNDLLNRSYIVIDLETTGFYSGKGDKIIALAGIKVDQGRIDKSNVFNSLVNPQKNIPEVIVNLTGIKNEDVAGKDTIEKVLPGFLTWAGDGTLAGHALDFDLSFLKKNLDKDNGLLRQCLDTRTLVGLLYPGLSCKSLFYIAEYFDLKIVRKHDALEDAILTAEILAIALKELEKQNINTMESLDRMIRGRNLILPLQFSKS